MRHEHTSYREKITKHTAIFTARISGVSVQEITEIHDITKTIVYLIFNTYLHELVKFIDKNNIEMPYTKKLYSKAFQEPNYFDSEKLTYEQLVEHKEFWLNSTKQYFKYLCPDKKLKLELTDSVKHLDLPPVIHGIFDWNKWETIGQVYELIKKGDAWRKIPSMGVSRFRLIVAALEKHGFVFQEVAMSYEEAIKVTLKHIASPEKFTKEEQMKLKVRLEATLANKGIPNLIEA